MEIPLLQDIVVTMTLLCVYWPDFQAVRTTEFKNALYELVFVSFMLQSWGLVQVIDNGPTVV